MPIIARGGWANMPHVIWEDRSEVQFQLAEGVMSSVSMSILLNSKVTHTSGGQSIIIPKREIFSKEDIYLMDPEDNNSDRLIYLEHWPVSYPEKKTFIL